MYRLKKETQWIENSLFGSNTRGLATTHGLRLGIKRLRVRGLMHVYYWGHHSTGLQLLQPRDMLILY